MTSVISKELVKKFFQGDMFSIARLISLVENQEENIDDIIATIYPHTGKAHLVGITGPPGAGKSTLIDKLIYLAREKKKKVAVLCVDPSSPFSGGAILGDRIRMQAHAGDENVFIRSIGTRGGQGGLSRTSQKAVMLLDAAGFDLVILETAGVGQTELGILGVTHTNVVVLVPESGDEVQMMKAGILEIADILNVNKCDRVGSDHIIKSLTMSLELSHGAKGSWSVPITKTVAEKNQGISELYQSIEEHYRFLKKSGEIKEKNHRFARTILMNIASDMVTRASTRFFQTKSGLDLIEQVARGEQDPFLAAKKLLTLKKLS